MDKNVEYNVLEDILARKENPKHLPFHILENITQYSSQEAKIGEGGFGDVYKGILPNGSVVAVKRIPVTTLTIEDRLFNREVNSLLKIKDHPNLVRFLGYCYNTHHEMIKTIGSESFLSIQKRERLLCFEYVSNGSLDKHITDELRGLEWNIRYQIIKGICVGLQYLHREMGIIHMDLKPANIMVDTRMVPKITDFGLARPDGKSITTGDRFVSRGYSSPEYRNGGKTTIQCDIYSLGVIIIELLTGHVGIPEKNKVLRRWRHRWKSTGHTPLLAQQVIKCIEIAESCIENEPKKRPSLSDIIHDLDETGNKTGHISAAGRISPSLDDDDDDMLGIGPLELRFAFEFDKEISNAVKLTNETGNCVAFNIKTVSQLKYYTQPNKGIVPPRSKITVKITLQAQEKIPGYMPHADEFIVQSTKVKDGLKVEEITEEVFNDKAGKVVDKVNLTVVYDDESVKPQADQSLETIVRVSEETSLREQGIERQRLNFRPPLQTILTTNENARDLMPGTVTAMTGAMGRLLPKLRELHDLEHNLQTSVKKYFESLERQLKRMHARLYKLSRAQLDQLDEEDKVWAIEVRELSYDIEDIVDDLIVRIEHSKPITDQEGLIERVEDIMVRVKELAEWYGYKVHDSVPTPAVISRTVDPRLSTLYKDHRELVGIDGPRDELVRRLRGKGDEASSKQLKIISIFGEGGLGKTTLAKAVFDKLAAEFLIKAFVPVGRNPDTKRVLEDILYEIDKQTNENIHQKNLDERQLIDKLQNVLQNKRYLMVIDDIWDRSSWDTIKYGLINNDKGSGVITTSRIFEVAENSGEVCQLKPLSCDHSKELFYARLGSKGAYISDQLDDKSTKYILEKCGGLPLAIITIASLLAGKSAEEWSEVYSRIGFGQEGTRAQNTKKILLFSYNDLPTHLKTCFLYLSIFPEDHMIEKNALVWKWIAEGFVHEEKGQTLFEVGERYFNELINRSMMQPVEAIGPWYEHIFETYDIWACRVHDMVHDLICSMAKEENFVTIVDRNEKHLSSQNKARIVAVQNRVLDQYDLAKTCKQEVMRSFNATKCDISREALDSLLTRFRVLQVLSLEGSLTIISRWTPVDVYGLKNLARLHHLRYLGLSRTAINEQPMELGDLRFLQFLDLRETGIKAVPQSVTLLRELKCLRCGTFDAPVTLPDGMGSLTSLEELRLQVASSRPGYSYLLRTKGVDQKHPLADFSTELGKLTALRVLHVKISEFPDKLEELALVESLNKLKKLVELEVVYRSNDNLDICHGYLPCPRLRRLCLGHEIELPVWISTSSLRNLSYLSLSLTSMKPGDLNNIGSLPELRSFLVSCDLDFCDVIAAGAFPKLRFWANNSMIAYQQGAMSCLEFLQLDFHAKAYIGFDFGSLQYLPALEKVFAQIYCGDVKRKEGEAVKAALRHSIDNHPNHPTADLIKFGRYTDIKRDDAEEVKVSPRLASLRKKEKAARHAWLRKREKSLRGAVYNHGNRPILNHKIFGECSDDKFNENEDIEKE